MDAYIASVKVLTAGLHPPIPDAKDYPVISSIMEDCFQFSPDNRPNFQQIYKQLDDYFSANQTLNNKNGGNHGSAVFDNAPANYNTSQQAADYNNSQQAADYNTSQQAVDYNTSQKAADYNNSQHQSSHYNNFKKN